MNRESPAPSHLQNNDIIFNDNNDEWGLNLDDDLALNQTRASSIEVGRDAPGSLKGFSPRRDSTLSLNVGADKNEPSFMDMDIEKNVIALSVENNDFHNFDDQPEFNSFEFNEVGGNESFEIGNNNGASKSLFV